MPNVVCLGDLADHPGMVIQSGQESTGDAVKIGTFPVAVEGAMFQCDAPDHGITFIVPNQAIMNVSGKLVIVDGAMAGCGATIIATPRGVSIG